MVIRKHVLIVDDEADIRELLVLTLGRMGVEAEAVSSVKEASAALERQAFDLCLTDMRLPDGDGLELLKHISENHGNTPVAVITGPPPVAPSTVISRARLPPALR